MLAFTDVLVVYGRLPAASCVNQVQPTKLLPAGRKRLRLSEILTAPRMF